MAKKVIGVIVSIIIGYGLAYLTQGHESIITGFIASMLTFIYFEMPNKK